MILYTTDTCPRCSIVKKKLDDANIKYEVSQDMDKMIELNIRSVPQLQIDEDLLDFSKIIKYIKENS